MDPHSTARNLITKAVMGATTTDDKIVVSRDIREWLRDLLLDEAKQEVYVENIETHYEDIESLNKLDVMHSLRCQKHVKNCALQMYSNYSIGGITIIMKKHMLAIRNVSILFLIPFSSLHINYFIVTYHTFVSYNFREKQGTNNFKIMSFFKFHTFICHIMHHIQYYSK